MAHTPGPWKVKHKPHLAIYGPNGHLVALVQVPCGWDFNANARLIAAAPEILAALEMLLEDGTFKHMGAAALTARALLDRVEGGLR